MKSKNKKISGISLITLIITIAVVIILIAAIIIGLGKNNSIDTSRVTKVLSNRDHIESNIKLYVSNVQSETKNYFTPVQIIAGNVPRRTYTINEILKNGTIDYRIAKCVEVMIEKNSVQKMVYRIDEEKYKEKMGQDIPEVPDVKNSAWYVDSEGTVYLAFNNKDNIPKYIKGDAQGDTLSENSLMDEYLIITDIDVCEEFNIADIDDPYIPPEEEPEPEPEEPVMPDTDLDWFTWTIANDKVTITGFNQEKIDKMGYYPTEVKFPQTIEKLPVIGISSSAFYNRNLITYIYVPEGVTTIGNRAFQYCSSLTEVYLPSTLSSIDNHANNESYSPFYSCKNITKITVPQYVISDNVYASNVFCDSRGSIKTIAYSGQIDYIGTYAFNGFTALTTGGIDLIPATVTSIKNNAFSNCSSIPYIVIPHLVTSIGSSAFSNCTGAQSLTMMGDLLTTIGSSAFSSCSSIPTVSIPEGVTTIGDCAFQYCTSLNVVYLPSTLNYISNSTSYSYAPFYSCKNITKITVPQYVVGGNVNACNVFYDSRSKIKEVYLNGNVSSINNNSFSGFSDVTFYFYGSVPSGEPWGASNINIVQL